MLPRGSSGYHLALQGRAAIPGPELETLVRQGKAFEKDYYVNQIAQTQDMIPSVVIPLAFPLLLFSLNIKKWLRYYSFFEYSDNFIFLMIARTSFSGFTPTSSTFKIIRLS
jgi:hypothetical protein